MHLAELLAQAGDQAGAVREAAAVLQRDPTNTAARAVIGAPTADPSACTADSQGEDDDATLRALDAQLRDVVPPMFVDQSAESVDYEAEPETLKLADVAGMTEVKARLEASFLTPLRNPALRRL